MKKSVFLPRQFDKVWRVRLVGLGRQIFILKIRSSNLLLATRNDRTCIKFGFFCPKKTNREHNDGKSEEI